MNASTFTARIAASTGADCAACLSAAVGTLSGPLHGGAPARVLPMLDAVAESGDAEKLRQRPARARRADHGLRPPRLPRRGSARARPEANGEGARVAARRGRRGARAGRDRGAARAASRPPARDQRRVLGRGRPRDRAHPGGDHARALRVRAHRRLVGAHRRAEADRPADPSERGLRRPVRETPRGPDGTRSTERTSSSRRGRTSSSVELPADVEIFDAHVHLGDDIDGMRGRPDELLAIMDEYGVGRAFMFCLDEPDRHPGFRAPNDRTLAYARESNGRLIPFVRLDLNEDPIAEAKRCIDAGARGIKLHPRAQKISLEDERLTPVFQLACERNVPILIHGGRGLPPIAAHLHALVERCAGVQLIVAHAGIADMANLTARFAGLPGVFFDTSMWSAVDLLDFYRQMPPEQIVYASDYPYAPPAELAADGAAHRTARRLRRARDRATCSHGNAHAHRERRAAARADEAEGRRRAHAADDHGAHPPVPLDGDAADVDAASRTRSASSASRSTRATRRRTATARRRSRSASCSRRRRCSGSPRSATTRRRSASAARRIVSRLTHLADILAVTASHA